MSIVKRISCQVYDKACGCKERGHLGLHHKHTAAIFEKGHTSILAYGRNHKSCILRRSVEGECSNKQWEKGRQKGFGMQNYSRGAGLYKQLPIREKDRKYNIKTLYYRTPSTLSNWRIAYV